MKNKKIVTVNKNTNSGTLTGIGKHYYKIDYPMTVVIVGLYRINENPDRANLSPMRVSQDNLGLNCVAERVMEHFMNACRGNKLTEQWSKKIVLWGESVKDTGATIDDVKKIESLLRFPISVKTITSEVLHEQI